ncbi:DUF6087 family protein [Streptomyces griseofuscus]|uniref:DUF6087 family protein n=1 Tax=Streptomyces griseofuscus TaxID=146922 RepID=UPI0036AA4770
MDDEPLAEWAECRELRRPARGERRATPLGDRPEHGAHVEPDAPRGIQEWDGHRWTAVGVAEDQDAAAAATGRDANAHAERVPLPAFGKLPPMPEPWRPTQRLYRPGTPRQQFSKPTPPGCPEPGERSHTPQALYPRKCPLTSPTR